MITPAPDAIHRFQVARGQNQVVFEEICTIEAPLDKNIFFSSLKIFEYSDIIGRVMDLSARERFLERLDRFLDVGILSISDARIFVDCTVLKKMDLSAVHNIGALVNDRGQDGLKKLRSIERHYDNRRRVHFYDLSKPTAFNSALTTLHTGLRISRHFRY